MRPGWITVSRHLQRDTILVGCTLALVLSFAPAAAEESVEGVLRLMRPALPAPAALGTSTVVGDTIWVGRKAGWSGNWWGIGTGPARPGTNTDGTWTWDSPVHGDSLQGWWPVRHAHTNASGVTRPDVERPWWAIEIGNQANYVVNQGRFDASKIGAPYAGNRTFGVVGMWHSDPGSAAGGGVNWAPLEGARSAWMGLRRHGDLTATDPVTGNPFNGDLLVWGNTVGAGSGTLTNRDLPGYGSQMDQMLYRDLDLSGVPADSGLRIVFSFRTEMSTGKNTVTSTRTGWFEGDPLTSPVDHPDNFISAEAGSPANTLAPVDSFQVYVGAPVEGTWVGSDGVTRTVYDPLRRWFNEVLRKDARFWKFSRAGADSGQVTLVVSKAEKDAILAAAGSPTLRLVFRAHTNRGFDDESGPSTYTSNGRGAAQVDDVRLRVGAEDLPLGDFEGGDPSKDIDNLLPATLAWRSTGKPPAVTFHVHDLSSLVWDDVCGMPGTVDARCDMLGPVIAMGDHDRDESAYGIALTAEEASAQVIVSPTISLKASPGVKNGWDLTQEEATASTNYVMAYDLYSGIFDPFTQGNVWQIGAQAYPCLQPDGTPAWGDMRTPVGILFDPIHECARWVNDLTGLIASSNAPGPPDSVRIYFQKLTFCYRFGITDCHGPAGAYLDDISFGIVDTPAQLVSVDLWDWFQDTFPFNGDDALPGTAAFDTTAALVRTGLNTAGLTATLQRFDVPGDSLVVYAPGADTRIDLVFRIDPGPGNYVVSGDRASGLRRVPTSPTALSVGDGSWWDAWRTTPGDFATPGAAALHALAPGGWDRNVWMSARCDTAETGLFPVAARAIGLPEPGRWMSTLHESDPHFASLGVPRHECFLVDPAGPANSTNITCSSVPAWVTPAVGYDGDPMTIEGTAILPDGLFTPGTRIQYFVRRSPVGGGTATLVPDTTRVFPQVGAGSYDGQRWESWRVLPDLWRRHVPGAPPLGMLVLDWADGSGDELAWSSAADSAGLVSGAYRGWRGAPPGADVNDPAYFTSAMPDPGGLLAVAELYQVRGGGGIASVPAGTIGSRYAYHDPSPANLTNGKESSQGPTRAMLEVYYGVVALLTANLGDWTSPDYGLPFLGPFPDRSADDRRVLRDFLSTDPASRALHIMGDGFVSSHAGDSLVTEFLGASDVGLPYGQVAGDSRRWTDLLPAFPGGVWSVVGLRQGCGYDPSHANLAVLGPLPSQPGAALAARYAPPGGAPTLGASVRNQGTVASHAWTTLADGFGVQQLGSRFGDNSAGRIQYLRGVACDLYWPTLGYPIADCGLANAPPGPALVDQARVIGNPARSGATLELGLRAADRVEVRLYDVSGRLVRRLADRVFPAGTHRLAWDGRGDDGAAARPGAYFARVRFASRGFERVTKVIVLR